MWTISERADMVTAGAAGESICVNVALEARGAGRTEGEGRGRGSDHVRVRIDGRLVRRRTSGQRNADDEGGDHSSEEPEPACEAATA
jgi:hypothetical protein